MQYKIEISGEKLISVKIPENSYDISELVC